MTDCTALLNPQVSDVFMCAFNLATGGFFLSMLLVFILLVYALYLFRVPMLASSGIVILTLFVFAGAGVADSGMPEIFKTLLLLAIMLFGAIVVLAFWRLQRI